MTVKNAKQAQITKTRIELFENAIREKSHYPIPDDTDPVIWEAYIRGMESQLETLRSELSEFETRTGAGDGARTHNGTEF